jgi:putative transposase
LTCIRKKNWWRQDSSLQNAHQGEPFLREQPQPERPDRVPSVTLKWRDWLACQDVSTIAMRVRDLIRDICGQHEVSIMKGHVSKDHVHLLISLPPQVTISMQWLKGRTAHHLLAEFPHLKKQFRGRHLWARGYFCCSSGNVTDDVIAKYIAEQNVDQDEDFKVDG